MSPGPCDVPTLLPSGPGAATRVRHPKKPSGHPKFKNPVSVGTVMTLTGGSGGAHSEPIPVHSPVPCPQPLSPPYSPCPLPTAPVPSLPGLSCNYRVRAAPKSPRRGRKQEGQEEKRADFLPPQPRQRNGGGATKDEFSLPQPPEPGEAQMLRRKKAAFTAANKGIETLFRGSGMCGSSWGAPRCAELQGNGSRGERGRGMPWGNGTVMGSPWLPVLNRVRDTLGVLFLPLRLRSQEGWFSRGPCQVGDVTTPRTPS